ncbi:MAG: CoB--CoM heterodisulfide reductase iron-sulfur subunit A family protein [Acidobacteriaceae bacterium]
MTTSAQQDNTYRPDALIVGGGIAGMQSALDLADQGLQVLIVERESSIGGHMIALAKVFPTLDCASCITAPKMSASAHHENIRIMVNTEVQAIRTLDGVHHVQLLQKATYVNFDKCIGCRLCEYACDSEYPDPFEMGLGAKRAISVPFTNAIPQKAVLDAELCTTCGSCARVCPTDAIEFDQQSQQVEILTDAVVVASGFALNSLAVKPQYNALRSKNIISALTMERLLAPHGPYGRVLRPSDGKVPSSVAFVQCAGSRDASIGVSYCSRVCCMYAIKQAMLLSGALPIADITVYYMDIRAFGKGYEQFYQNAKAMGVNFVRGKVARINPIEDGDLSLHVETTEEAENFLQERRHDLVVLAQGMLPEWDPSGKTPVSLSSDGFVATPSLTSPTRTTAPGIFVAGVASGPKDIVDTIAEAGAAAMQVSQYLYQKRTAAAEELGPVLVG